MPNIREHDRQLCLTCAESDNLKIYIDRCDCCGQPIPPGFTFDREKQPNIGMKITFVAALMLVCSFVF